MPDPDQPHNGGIEISGGDVEAGGDFVGGDKITNINYAAPRESSSNLGRLAMLLVGGLGVVAIALILIFALNLPVRLAGDTPREPSPAPIPTKTPPQLYSFRGLVKVGNQPISNAEVDLFKERTLVQVSKTDQTGHYSFDALQGTAYSLQARSPFGKSELADVLFMGYDSVPDLNIITPVEIRYNELGRSASWLGPPSTVVSIAPDGEGLFQIYQNFGSIYWHPKTGAYFVRGAIRDAWAKLGHETSALGYPITDELTTPDGLGAYNHFQGGSIYWTPGTGAHAVVGAFQTFWGKMGWETSPLGYPTSDETVRDDGTHVIQFQHGCASWKPGEAVELGC